MLRAAFIATLTLLVASPGRAATIHVPGFRDPQPVGSPHAGSRLDVEPGHG